MIGSFFFFLVKLKGQLPLVKESFNKNTKHMDFSQIVWRTLYAPVKIVIIHMLNFMMELAPIAGPIL